MLNEIFSEQKPLPIFEITEMTKPESHSSLDPLLYVSSPGLPSEKNEDGKEPALTTNPPSVPK
jgi:hypothetical protein